ncbi:MULTISPECIES: permease [Carboxydocella]|uniref:Permease n=2 Tax=Carboxydocella TaxID=178898 RepID=A0A1T4PZN2_9FIRM|nr:MULTISPECIES: permease [Carboxydocella]AVX21241.1 hypothetical protein CFE_2076 [Carboxydocella thermautotrophica]AVX31673.1 hypothetical protein CTH_2109 [Carboxydocella thermautotrophica]SJZ97040.1 hypothetical protein SAMN02745885_01475 [Carboxydocella sporoproducens DSM 16521]GAW29287.1 hypothetical protein ULO1_18570 [Carboxydocella sp. ULO1]GAW30761.1 hypothetical protein JDF658_05260 [Carboxydocella sp. JDF658]
MDNFILYIASIGLLFSFIKDKKKTRQALIKAKNSFLNLLPEVLSIMFFVGISLSIINPPTVSKIIGKQSGILGVIIALSIGSITLIPSFIAFPLGATLLSNGAGYTQVAAFVSTLMAVGIATLPAEIKYFNKPTAILRNGLALIICILFTFLISQVMNK